MNFREILRRALTRRNLDKSPVSGFFGDHRFLSNFWPAEVRLEGISYPTVEHAYQAAKCVDPAVRGQIRDAAKPGKAKKMGSRADVRPDWEQIRVEVMHDLVRQKFLKHRDLGDLLLATGSAELIEENTWGDTFWGVCDGEGENRLGRILMEVREKIAEERGL